MGVSDERGIPVVPRTAHAPVVTEGMSLAAAGSVFRGEDLDSLIRTVLPLYSLIRVVLPPVSGSLGAVHLSHHKWKMIR